MHTNLQLPTVEPLLCIHRLSQQDITNINENLKRKQSKMSEKKAMQLKQKRMSIKGITEESKLGGPKLGKLNIKTYGVRK